MPSYTDTLSRVMSGGYDDASEEERDEAVRDVTQVCSVAAAALTIQPIPFVDSALIIPIQVGMVQAIGRIRGHSLDRKAVLEILSTFGASIVAQNVAIAAAKFVPFFGWVVAPSMAYALTWAIAEVADHYFRNGRGVPPDELREMFSKVYRQKRTEKEAANKENDSLKAKLQQLKDAYEAGLLDEDEFSAQKEKILADF
jgi:uncharacterized protein (DUF697 family)